MSIAELERETLVRADDLDAALLFMTRLQVLSDRLGGKERSMLMQILVERFIVDPQDKIIECQLNSPFAFLQNLVEELSNLDSESRRSTQIPVGALYIGV